MSSPLYRQAQFGESLLGSFLTVKDALARLAIDSAPSSALLLPVFLWPVISGLIRSIRDDYNLFLSLGPGGTPSTPLGYLKICVLRLLIANKDVFTPPKYDRVRDLPGAYFDSVLELPSRKGNRPIVAGIAPQRQTSQRGNEAQIAALQACMRSIASANADTLATGRSCFEKQSLALFLKNRTNVHGVGNRRGISPSTNANFSDAHAALVIDTLDSEPINATCGLPPEVAHMHGSEGSLHLTLHPEDAAVVIQRAWGERHPLAGAGGLVRDVVNGRGMKALCGRGTSEGWLPKGFVMVYAPRDEEERQVVGKIVRAAAWWVGGVKLREGGEF